MNKREEHTAVTQKRGARLASAHQLRARNRRLLAVLGCIAVLATAFALMLPALSMTRGALVCDLEEHTHTKACYEQVLVCGQEEGEGADPETGEGGHVHTKECYEKQLACGKAEHKHTDACYEQVTSDESADKGEGDSASGAADSNAGEAGNGADSQDAAGDPSGSDDADDPSGEGDAADQSTSSESASSVGALEPGAEADMPAQSFKADLKDAKGKVTLTVEVEAPQGAFPAGTFMKIDGVAANKIEGAVEKAVAKKTDGKVTKIQAVDITFREGDAEGKEIEPARDITVKLTSKLIAETEKPLVVHVDDKGKADVVDTLTKKQLKKRDLKAEDDQLLFDADKFSTYGIVVTTLEQTLTASDGNNYTVTVTAPAEAGVPADAELMVEEIGSESGEYEQYVARTEEALGWDVGSISYARLFDIRIVGADGSEIQPVEGSSVHVDVKLGDKGGEADSQVVHFGETTEVLDVQVEGGTVSFETTGFSVYSIVEAPDYHYEEAGEHVADSLQAIRELGTRGFFVGNVVKSKRYYLNGGVEENVTGDSDRYGLKATESTDNSITSDAVKFFFEPVTDTEDQFYIYTLIDNQRRYVQMTKVANKPARAGLNLVDEDDRTAFTLGEKGSSNTFYVSANVGGTAYYWNRNGKTQGEGAIVGYNSNADGNNSLIELHYVTEAVHDPYGLNGKSFGIAYHDESATAGAMTSTSKTVSSQQGLEGLQLVMKPNVQNNNGILLVAENSDITEWTFESVSENKYYITTMVSGARKYLSIDGGNILLQDEPDDVKSLATITNGSGAYSGKYRFTVNGRSLNFVSNTFNAATGNKATMWLNLVEKSNLTEDDFVNYTARKISASDDALKGSMTTVTDDEGHEQEVFEKAQVILYTRLWNDEAKRYEYYAVDHDGSLVRVYESGDVIQWVGNKVNSALWEFTEYTNDGTPTGTPNGYYELENIAYPSNYLAPQSGGIISDSTVGINLSGRTDGFDYTPVVAWDRKGYAFFGLKIDTETMNVVTCPLDEADDFYFATIVPTVDEEDAGPVSTVKTVDNDAYGISMKMIDFNNPIIKVPVGNRDSKQHELLGQISGQVRSGLLSQTLGSDGYPTTTNVANTPNQSLSWLFDNMTPVNHLFIQSIYNESGYFEYNSTQNFAHLNENNTFTVYDQLGAITGSNETGKTRTHGQFMPYDNISEDRGYAYTADGKAITNQTDVLGNPLPDSDPRKGENLYTVGNNSEVDYFFGMELEASFTQTASGLDDWGHDIIFEFSGDDDFWFYVDGVLVLDLGDVHSAEKASVNFRTGEVKSSRRNTITTLYDIFSEVLPDRVNDLFEEKEVDGKTVHVFKDYTKHNMKMFYMERGQGASNLHMRFNLASVMPGTVELGKKLTGADSATNKLIQYPYQIWYTTNEPVIGANDEPERDEQGNIIYAESESVRMVQGNKTDPVRVVFKGTNTLIPFEDSLTIDGREYKDVFLLKAGQTAVINLPENVASYKIIECGVDTEVYSKVSVNWEQGTDKLEGRLYNNTDGESSGSGGDETNGETRLDFGLPYKTTDERPSVTYENEVHPEAMRTLSFTKVVYDTTGINRLTTDQVKATFMFRLFLGNEYADADSLSPANMYSYCVKDPSGNYCRWNSETETFDSLGVNAYASLTDEQKKDATFTTSIYGTIDSIPANYTVEVRDLIVGTKWKLEERDSEVPKGYTRREADGYVRTDLGEPGYIYTTDAQTSEYGKVVLDPQNPKVSQPINEIIAKNENAHVEVRNQEGWGLTAKKVWTDKDFMTHDDIYFAVYLKNADGTLGDMINGSVRRLQNKDIEVYYFFSDLRDQNNSSITHTFNEYVVREVMLEGDSITTDSATGVVNGYTSVTPIRGVEGDNKLIVGGTPAGGTHQDGYTYTVSYATGDSTGANAKIRTDTVTNSRPGIELYKMRWDGQTPLAGAKFTLKDADGNDVAASTYTSDDNGKITIAYLSAGNYVLTETAPPKGFVAPSAPLNIAVGENGTVSITCDETDNALYEIDDSLDNGMTARITVKNRSSSLLVKKVDADSSEPIEGAHFALYRQAANGEKPLNPIDGYENIVTTSAGVLTGVNLDALRAGTYYLTEFEAASGYAKLAGDLVFTIGIDGAVTVVSEGHERWLSSEIDENGQVNFVFEIPNEKGVKVKLVKVGYDNRTNAVVDGTLGGATFTIYSNEEHTAIASGIIAGQDQYSELKNLSSSDETGIFFDGTLPIGRLYLHETAVPAGYYGPAEDVIVDVQTTGVSIYKNGQSIPATGNAESGYTLEIQNVVGLELPMTGGMGTWTLYLLGIGLVLLAGGMLVARRRPLAVLSRELAYTRARNKLGRRVYQHKGFTRIVATRRNRRRPR